MLSFSPCGSIRNILESRQYWLWRWHLYGSRVCQTLLSGDGVSSVEFVNLQLKLLGKRTQKASDDLKTSVQSTLGNVGTEETRILYVPWRLLYSSYLKRSEDEYECPSFLLRNTRASLEDLSDGFLQLFRRRTDPVSRDENAQRDGIVQLVFCFGYWSVWITDASWNTTHLVSLERQMLLSRASHGLP